MSDTPQSDATAPSSPSALSGLSGNGAPEGSNGTGGGQGAVQRIWAPWRLEYITGKLPKHDGCIFCDFPLEADPVVHFILGFSRTCFVVLNKFPYNSGHIMVVPRRHVDSMLKLEADEIADLFSTVRLMEGVLRDAYRCGGLNVGMNIGTAAGAGIDDHLHVHLVPRWAADTNFMPVLADVRVLPEILGQTYEKLLPGVRAVGLTPDCPWK